MNIPKNKFLIIFALGVLILVLIFLIFFNGLGSLKKNEGEMITPKESGAGEIGEIYQKNEETGEEKPIVTPIMPPAIFSTTGKIKAVKENGIIIRGDGYNFADNVKRDLEVLFNEDTLVFLSNQMENHKGPEGLDYLSLGDEVLINSQKNIRGKIQFTAKTINVLQ